MDQLPIVEALPELLAALEAGRNAVLVAEPGAGKTTKVPLALLGQRWLGDKRIIMLEPRRLAARSAAIYMSQLLGEQVGGTVGYRVRMDAKVGPGTVIEVVTEGILTRMLQSDAALEGVGAILFDEFHERHLHGDLGLALALQSQSLLREDLRLIVMSATLDAEPVAALLGDAAVISSRGRVFAVETIYAAAKSTGKLEAAVGRTIAEALRRHEGDVLAFLPGLAEIRRTARWLAASGLAPGVRLAELHGSLPLARQSDAIAPCPPGERKIVLATSIAESSLTVEGIRVVVDCGLMRVPRFSSRTGMSRLETIPVSVASADQRRGRAGRLAPGVCYRLWTEAEHAYLPPQGQPELLEADLAPLALELALWGVRDPQELEWLTPPPAAAYEQAQTLLRHLGTIDRDGKPTDAGTQIAGLGLHPRLGVMLLQAAGTPALTTACKLAALLGDRDPLPTERNVDIQLRLDRLNDASQAGGFDAAAQRSNAQAALWRNMLEQTRTGRRSAASELRRTGAPGGAHAQMAEDMAASGPYTLGVLLALAFPDRVAQRRSDGRYLLANGRGALLPDDQPLSAYPYLVACELDDAGTEGRIRLAAAASLEHLERLLQSDLISEETVEWDDTAKAVRAMRRIKLGAITLRERRIQQPDQQLVASALLAAIRRGGLNMLPLGKNAKGLLARMRLMRMSGLPEWPDVSDEALLDTLEEWLLPHLYGIRSHSELQKLHMADIAGAMLSWKQRQELDEQAPTHWVVPSGSRIPIDYANPEAPVLAVRLQELFGLKETPRLANGRLPLTLHLLSPSQRPVQVTQDLTSFWETAYFEVKKDLKGRYPKHYWPDNPYEAVPTSRAKPRTGR